MAPIVTLACAGLMTDANALAAPNGALRIADDVICERGTARPRLGLNAYFADSTSQRPRSMYTWGQASVVSSWDGASTYQVNSDDTSLITGEAEPLDRSLSWVQFAPSRDNLYWTSKKGPRKITSAADTASDAAGMHEATSGLPSVATSGTPVVLPTNYAAAWRWCFRKIDANGLETRSAPSPWQTMNNTSGSTVDMSWIIPLPLYVVAGDQIELYRSVAVTPSTAVPSDTMYLARTYVVTSGDVTAGSVTLRDSTAETALGQELYTNPTREGAIKANGRPPACVAMTQWSDCMWFGYVRGPWTCAFDIVTVSGNTSTDGLTGLQRLNRVGDITSGSAVITNIASTTSVKAGQLISSGTPGSSPAGIPVGTTVLSKTATTITMSANATATTVGLSFYVHDGIRVDGLTYWAGNTEITTGSYPTFAVNTGNRERSTARSLAYVISRRSTSVFAFAIEDPYYRNPLNPFEQYAQATVVVRSRELDASQFIVSFIADSTSDQPAVAFNTDSAGAVLVNRDDFPHGIAYSKPREPEHVPELNFITIGNENDPVIAFAPLSSALLVFKRDGIFRVTGSPPDGWRVDLLAPSFRIIRGECVGMVDNTAWVWTSRGVVRVDEGGATSASDGAISRALEERAGVALSQTAISCAWVQTVPLHNLVLVGTCDSQANRLQTDSVFCLCTNGGGWSRWTFSSTCASVTGRGELRVARAGYWDIRETTPAFASTSDPTMDSLYVIATWTNGSGSTTITLAEADMGFWVPKVGDWVSAVIGGATYYRRITAAVDGGATWTLTIASAFPAGSQSDRFGYESIVSKLEWQGHYVGPAKSAHVSEMHALMDWTAYSGSDGGSTARLVLGMRTDITPTRQTVTSDAETRAAKTIDIRSLPPRDVARGTHFLPYLETDDIGLEWRCMGIALEVNPVSERTNR